MSRLDRRYAHYAAAGTLAGGMGAAVPFVPTPALLAFAVAAAFPLLAVLLDEPLWLLGLFCTVQILEEYQYETPVGSLSVGILLLAALVYTQGGSVGALLARSGPFKVGMSLLALWLATFLLRATYLPSSEAFRGVTLAASSIAVVLVAATFARDNRTMPIVAYGTAFGLLVIGGLGILASAGFIEFPPRQQFAREFFGFEMPFRRNYGLRVGYDSVALLAPLAVSYLAVRITRPARLPAFGTLVALAFCFIAVFQARGMMFQILIAILAVPILLRPSRAWLAIPAAAVILVALLGQTNSADEVSTRSRSAVSAQVIDDLRSNPLQFATGQDEDDFVRVALGREGLSAAFRQFEDVPVHNFFFSNLVGGGWLAFFALLSAYLTMLVTAIRTWRTDTGDFTNQVLMLAAVLVTFESLVEPVAANIAGLWIVMGLVFGRSRAATRRERHHREGAGQFAVSALDSSAGPTRLPQTSS